MNVAWISDNSWRTASRHASIKPENSAEVSPRGEKFHNTYRMDLTTYRCGNMLRTPFGIFWFRYNKKRHDGFSFCTTTSAYSLPLWMTTFICSALKCVEHSYGNSPMNINGIYQHELLKNFIHLCQLSKHTSTSPCSTSPFSGVHISYFFLAQRAILWVGDIVEPNQSSVKLSLLCPPNESEGFVTAEWRATVGKLSTPPNLVQCRQGATRVHYLATAWEKVW